MTELNSPSFASVDSGRDEVTTFMAGSIKSTIRASATVVLPADDVDALWSDESFLGGDPVVVENVAEGGELGSENDILTAAASSLYDAYT